MQNHTKRSATDIRISAFKTLIALKRVVKDADMRKHLRCSRATYSREIKDYLNSMNGLMHDTALGLIGFAFDIEKLHKKQEAVHK